MTIIHLGEQTGALQLLRGFPDTQPHSPTHCMAVPCFWLCIQTRPCTLVIRSAEDYTKRDPSSPGEEGCLLSAARGSCWLDPPHFILHLLYLFLASPASAAAAPVHSQGVSSCPFFARAARRMRPKVTHTNLSQMQSTTSPERNQQLSPQCCLWEREEQAIVIHSNDCSSPQAQTPPSAGAATLFPEPDAVFMVQ